MRSLRELRASFQRGASAGSDRASDSPHEGVDVVAHIEKTLALLHADRWGGVAEVFDEARREAEQSWRRYREHRARPLEGIPFTCKRNICTIQGVTDAGSRALAGFRSPFEATVVERLRAAGGILVGKTRLDEFGMGSSGENTHGRIPRNPWSPAHVAGGSSSGAAVLAATLPGSFHLGSDTGGSVRLPASFCGVSGFKPTYGVFSRYGLVAFASSLDQIGVLASHASDLREVLRVASGIDPRDATSRDFHDDGEAAVGKPLFSRWRLGVPRNVFEGCDDLVKDCVEECIDELRARGATIVELDLFEPPGYGTTTAAVTDAAMANSCYQIISTAEACSNFARYDGVRYGVSRGGDTTEDSAEDGAAGGDASDRRGGPRRDSSAVVTENRSLLGEEVRRRLLLGTVVLSEGLSEATYQRALQVRESIRSAYCRALAAVDVVLTPTTPVMPFRLGERLDPLQLYACDSLTVSANLAGIPAISIPCGFRNGLPVGLQGVARHGGDDSLLRFAEEFCGGGS